MEVDLRSFSAAATVVEGPARDRLWAQHVAALPWFADYPDKTDRLIPMVRPTPRNGESEPLDQRPDIKERMMGTE